MSAPPNYFSDKTFKPAFHEPSPQNKTWEKQHPFIAYSHYISEVSSLKEIILWLEKLKEKNIFDNTRIVIVSDHGFWDSTYLMQAIGPQPFRSNYFGGNLVNPGMRSALLLFKDFQKNDALKTDTNALMSNSDTIEMILEGIINIPQNYATGYEERYDASRIRLYQAADVRSTRVQTLFQVKGSMYNKNNWSLKFSRDIPEKSRQTWTGSK